MKTLTTIIIASLLLPSLASAQLSLTQGGTGRSSFTAGDFIYANSDSFQRLTGTSTPSFLNYWFTNATGTNLTLSNLFSGSSAGLTLNSNNGTPIGLFGAGGGAGATFYGGVNIGTTTTAGTATTVFSPTMSGSSLTSNFLNLTGTMPSPTSAGARAIRLLITSQGSSSNPQYATDVALSSGYTGTRSTVGINVTNTAGGTGTGFWTNGSYNVGIYSSGSGTTAGHNVGFAGNASASSALNVGVYGRSTASINSPNLNIGSVALATGATYNVGGFFGLFSAAAPTIAQSAVLMADNGSTGSDIFVARANGTATAKIDGTGNLIWATDNTNDIGASGATRPRTGYFGTSLISPLVTTPSLTTSSGALTITPASGSNLNVSLSGTGDFAVNTDQLYVDTSAGNVGIGTTAPGLLGYSRSLTVEARTSGQNAGVEILGYRTGNNENAGGYEFYNYNGSSAVNIGAIRGRTSASSVSQGDLAFYTNGGSLTERMRIVDTGNVGIGTTNPATKLHLYEPSATSTAYISSGGAGLGGRLIMEDVDGAGCTEITTLDGVISAKTVTCP